MNIGSLKIVLGEENISQSSLYRSIGRLYGSDPSSRSLIDKAILRPIPGHDKNSSQLRLMMGTGTRKQSDMWSNSKKNDTKNNHSSGSITQGTGSSSSSYYDRTKDKLSNKPIHIRTSSSYMENEIQDKRKGKR